MKVLPQKSKDIIKYWVEERQRIYLKKKNGETFPWSDDKIFQEKRFCNVLRELDKETCWIINTWLKPLEKINSDKLWFAPFIFRAFNLGSTFNHYKNNGLELVTNFLKESNEFICSLKGKERIFSPAYMITTHGEPCKNKAEFLIKNDLPLVLDKEKEIKEILKSNSFEESFYGIRELKIPNFGGFMLYQALLDLTYTNILKNHKDKYEFTLSGPGSNRGINRLFERDKDTTIKQKQALEELKIILDFANSSEGINKSLFDNTFEDLNYKEEKFDIHTIEFWMCEIDKYIRVKTNDGRMKGYKKPI